MGLRGPMLRRSTDPISALTGCHAPARGAGRTAHAPGSPTPPLGPLGPQERAGDRRGARRAPPAEPPEALSPPLAGFPRARPRPRPPTPRPRAPDAPPSFSFFSMAVRACLSTGRRRGRGEGRRRPQLCRRRSAGSTEYRALRAAAQSGSGAPHGHNPCHRPCRRPCHPLPPCLRRGRRWERPAGLACCPWLWTGTWNVNSCSNGLRDSNKK